MSGAEPGRESSRAVVGETFEIRLKGIPTAGFRWQLDGAVQDGLAEPVGTRYEPSEGLLGGEATQVFQFRALRTGVVNLRFRYQRTWEVGVVKETEFTILIEDRGGA